MSAADRLDEIEARLNHEPCCEHEGAEYGNCFDCRNTGCAHAPYIENEHGYADLKGAVSALRAVLAVMDETLPEHPTAKWPITTANIRKRVQRVVEENL